MRERLGWAPRLQIAPGDWHQFQNALDPEDAYFIVHNDRPRLQINFEHMCRPKRDGTYSAQNDAIGIRTNALIEIIFVHWTVHRLNAVRNYEKFKKRRI
uniref:Uncharacterized protein n=1 Tax=Trichogramma kaykai TaxID=54128 RepID=A0ABD2X124_9HYME